MHFCSEKSHIIQVSKIHYNIQWIETLEGLISIRQLCIICGDCSQQEVMLNLDGNDA